MQTAQPNRSGTPVQHAYDRLRAAYRVTPFPSRAERENRLDRLEQMLRANQEIFIDAISADFGHRSRHETLLADVMITLEAIREARKHVGEWMQREPVRPKWFFLPSQSWVEHLPRGVVGIISPWNYPVNLALSPLAGALAAGNRVLIKPSELTARTSEALARAVRDAFSSDEVVVLEGDAAVARELTQLPLDHLVFTGSTHVGRLVAKAAAENCTSLTLELGGKSPTLIHSEYPLAKAAERIAIGKLFNAGQSCVAPDYVLVPEGSEEKFAAAFKDVVRRLYPDFANNPDYTSIANSKAFERLKALLTDAENKGAKVERLGQLPNVVGARKLAPALVFGATDKMQLMQEEIFGPILPVQTYRSLDEALEYINTHPRPLAFYYFDENERRAGDVLRRTLSGSACLNDTLLQFAQEGLPFGGIGTSGQGAYHGHTGFKTFSHARGVYASSPLSQVGRLQAPPYGKLLDRAIAFLLK
jgi:coniferyl-aldehyde dehydrogenase